MVDADVDAPLLRREPGLHARRVEQGLLLEGVRADEEGHEPKRRGGGEVVIQGVVEGLGLELEMRVRR